MIDATHTLAPARNALASAHMRFRRGRRVVFYLAARGLVALIRGLPGGLARLAMRALADLAWVLLRSDRRIALAQLEACFPDRSPEHRGWVARESFRKMGDNLVAAVRTDERVFVDAHSSARLEALADQSRPILVLLGHYGAWELVGPVLAQRLPDFAALTANPHNARVDRWLREEREARGVTVFDRHRERLGAAKWLRRGGTLAVLGDHRSGTTRPVRWFDLKAPTVVGPARLARWANAVVVAVHLRGGPGHYELCVDGVLDDANSRSEQDILEWGNAACTAWIREDPTQWTWWHDRLDLRGRLS